MNKNWNFENSYLKLSKIFYSNTTPDHFPNLKVILKNEELANSLNLEEVNFDNFISNLLIKGPRLKAFSSNVFDTFTISELSILWLE